MFFKEICLVGMQRVKMYLKYCFETNAYCCNTFGFYCNVFNAHLIIFIENAQYKY